MTQHGDPASDDYEPACDIWGDCEVSDEDERSGATEAMCIHCGGWRLRNYPYLGNWGQWMPGLERECTPVPL